MKGLLVKDLCLLKQQTRSFVMIIVLGLVISFAMQSTSVVISYIIFVAPLYSLSTISYDEFDHGNSFLFTLPFTRKQYVQEKFMLAIMTSFCAMVIGLCLSLVIGQEDPVPSLLMALLVFGIGLFLIAIMVPLTLQYGAEKAKVARLFIFAVIFLIGMGISTLMNWFGYDVAALLQAHLVILCIGGIIVLLMMLIGSMILSIRILEAKNF